MTPITGLLKDCRLRVAFRSQSTVEVPVAHAEKFHGGRSFSDTWWSFLFGVGCLWRHNLTL